ncbi:IS110 family transposase [Terrabacter sp. 2TAF16]|uniref:IS110 family transposase n=1 Tax=Terrabacter sp. 2TAF16 TaxID=3233008 RepID=UPI003F9870C7
MSRSSPCQPSAAAEFDVYCGIDVARETHHVVALDPSGRRLVDRPLPNAEPDLLELFAELEAHGQVLVVVDQLASIGALAVPVARSRGLTVAYLPGLSMRRVADLCPGEAKTDARDAHIIADAARTLPHALRRVGFEEHTTVELAVLAGYDADLDTEATRLTNRLHDALLHVHPALERLLGKHFRRPGVLRLVAVTGTPAAVAALGLAQIKKTIATGSPRIAADLTGQILTALSEQTVVIPACEQYGQVIRGLARQLLSVLEQREALAAQLQDLLATHPLAEILTSMPGVGPRTAIELLRTVGDGSTFASAAHVDSYTGLAPATRQSGRSIKGEQQARRGNRCLRGALYLPAFASLRHPASRAYYDRKKAEGKTHTAALTCPARRRVDVLHAMLRDRQTYRADHLDQSPPPPSDSPVAASRN